MKDLLQKFKSGGGSGVPRLTLAAFGKHPGWDDHIPAIGVETETLAYVEKIVYDRGIRGQIDSGGWEKAKLEPEQRLQGYDHLLLWLRPGHVILAELWSSTDGKGRLNYPMVLCVDGEGVGAPFMLEKVGLGLERIRDACKGAVTAGAVINTCRAAQEQLRGLLADPNAGSSSGGSFGPVDARRAFLEHRELGPDRLGLLRILHEINSIPGIGGNARTPGTAGTDSRHLRIPLATESRERSVLLWISFLRFVLPESCPVLLLARRNMIWLDLIIGEPKAEDFFCLQASSKALPLTTEIPYEITADSRERLRQIEAKFVGDSSTGFAKREVVPPVPSTPPPVRSSPQPATPVSPPAAFPAAAAPAPPLPSNVPPVSAAPPAAAGVAAKPTGRPLLVLAVVALLIVVGGVGAYILANRSASQSSSNAGKVQPSPATNAQPATEQQRAFQTALEEARAAFEKRDYSNAVAHAESALRVKTNDPAALKLLEEARKALSAAREEKYQNATNAAVAALKNQQFAEATNQATIALEIKPGDQTAMDLLLSAQQKMNVTIVSEEAQKVYSTATNLAMAALNRKDFREATNQAAIALTNKPGDAVAKGIMTNAQEGLQNQASAAKIQQDYESATNAAGTALRNKQYQEARKQAAAALLIKPDDAAAKQLKGRADEGLELAAAQNLFDQAKYSDALALCKKHPDNDAFASLSNRVNAEQKALDDMNKSFAGGDYAFIKDLQSQPYGTKAPFAALLTNALEEQKALADLTSLQKATNWTAVQTNMAGFSVERLKKAPFDDLVKWVEAQDKAAKLAGKRSVQELDADLEVLLVTFQFLKPTDSKIQSEKGRKAKPLNGPIEYKAQIDYLRQLEKLEAGYEEGDWLSQNDRVKTLKDLKNTIATWN